MSLRTEHGRVAARSGVEVEITRPVERRPRLVRLPCRREEAEALHRRPASRKHRDVTKRRTSSQSRVVERGLNTDATYDVKTPPLKIVELPRPQPLMHSFCEQSHSHILHTHTYTHTHTHVDAQTHSASRSFPAPQPRLNQQPLRRPRHHRLVQHQPRGRLRSRGFGVHSHGLPDPVPHGPLLQGSLVHSPMVHFPSTPGVQGSLTRGPGSRSGRSPRDPTPA